VHQETGAYKHFESDLKCRQQIIVRYTFTPATVSHT